MDVSQAPVAAAVSEAAPYPKPAAVPTRLGAEGIRFDFNLGARVALPEGKSWRIRLTDRETGNVIFESSAGAGFVNSTKRYFIRFGIDVFADDGKIFSHEYDAAGKRF